MSKPYRDHEKATVESLKKDPAFAAEYLNAVLEAGDQAELMLALPARLRSLLDPVLFERAHNTRIVVLYRC